MLVVSIYYMLDLDFLWSALKTSVCRVLMKPIKEISKIPEGQPSRFIVVSWAPLLTPPSLPRRLPGSPIRLFRADDH